MSDVQTNELLRATAACQAGYEVAPSSEGRRARIRTIIRNCAGIPEGIKNAPLNTISIRRFDDDLYQSLVTQEPPPGANGDWELRLRRRRDALSDQIGHTLACVYGHLPGCRYTIEVDPERALVYWEWLPV